MASKQPDLSELYDIARRRGRKPCGVAIARDQLNEKDAGTLDAACADQTGAFNTAVIAEFLARRNLEVTPTAISNHRRRVCSCGKS